MHLKKVLIKSGILMCEVTDLLTVCVFGNTSVIL